MLFIISGIQSGKSPMTPHLNLPPNSGSGLPKLDKLQRYTWEVLAHYLGEIPSNHDVQPIKFQIGKIQIIKKIMLFIFTDADTRDQISQEILAKYN